MDEMLATEYLTQGEVLLSNKQYENAIIYFKKAEKENPFNNELYLNLGIAYANTEQYDQAEQCFQKGLMINKESAVIYFHLGNIYFLKNDKSKGLQYYNQAIAKGYEDSQIYFSLGLMFEEDGNNSMALRNYSKSILQDPLRPDAYIRKARLYILSKQLPEAHQTLDEMIVACPDIFEGYHMKFSIYNNNGEYDKASQFLEKVRKLFPKDLGFVLDQASLYTNQKQYDEALSVLVEIEQNNNGDIDKRGIAIERAKIYALKRDMEHTIIYLKEAIERAKEQEPSYIDAEAQFFLMNCYINIEDFEKALACAKELQDMNQHGFYYISAYYFVPYCLNKLNKAQEAEEAYKTGVEELRKFSLKHPAAMDSYLYRILCLKELKQYDKALELADYLVMLKDDSSEAHTLRGVILTELGREEEAKKEKEKARSLGGMLAVLPANQE